MSKTKLGFSTGKGFLAKVDKAAQADNSSKVNNVEIKYDSNGVLKIDDLIIEQKKLIYDATTSGTGYVEIGTASNLANSIVLDTTIPTNATLEIVANISSHGTADIYRVFVKNGYICLRNILVNADSAGNLLSISQICLQTKSDNKTLEVYTPSCARYSISNGTTNFVNAASMELYKIYQIIE